jgi:trigger factor
VAQTYKVGSATMVEGLDEAVTGLSEGDSVEFTTTLAGGPAGGAEAEVEVTVRGVKEQQLPALDDDFADLASEFDTLDELRADLRERLTRVKRLQQAAQARDAVLAELLSRVDVPLPERVVAAQVDEHFSDGHGDGDHRDEVEAEARTAFTRQLVLDEIAQAEQLQVSQDDLTTYILSQAQQAGMEPQELAESLMKAGNLPLVAADVLRGKALALVVEEAAVTDASGRPVELKRLREDGSLATDEELAAEDAQSDPAVEGEPARG